MVASCFSQYAMPSVREGSIVTRAGANIYRAFPFAMSASPSKTRHLEERADEPLYGLDDEDDNYVPYVSVSSGSSTAYSSWHPVVGQKGISKKRNGRNKTKKRKKTRS